MVSKACLKFFVHRRKKKIQHGVPVANEVNLNHYRSSVHFLFVFIL